MAGLVGQLRGGAQVRRGGMITVQVDQAGRREQRQPAAGYQQAAVPGQRGPGVQQPAGIAEVGAGPAEKFGGRGAGIGRGQVVHRQLQPLDGGRPGLGGLGLPPELQGRDLIGRTVVPGRRRRLPAGCGRGSQGTQRPAGAQPRIQGLGQLR